MTSKPSDRNDETVPLQTGQRRSSIEQITTASSEDSALITRALRRLTDARRKAQQEGTVEGILRAYLHLLEQLCPGIDFAVQVSAASQQRTTPVQHATRRIIDNQQDLIYLSKAALVFSSTPLTTTLASKIEITDTYHQRMENAPHQAAGLDVPLRRTEMVIGVLIAESDHVARLTPNLRATLLLVADHIVASLDSAILKRETEHLRDYVEKLLQHANVPVIIAGRDRSVRVVSEALLRIAGIDRSAAVGADFVSLAPKPDRVRLLAAFVSATRGRTVSPIELKIPRASGGYARLSLKLASILDADGNVAGVIAIGKDLTAVRELEGQVFHADKLATIGQLATSVVHEINNPLTSISIYSEYLLEKLEELRAETADVDRARRIVESAERIRDFTSNLVTYARPSQEKPEEAQVQEILEESISFCEHVIDEAQVSITRQYAEHLPTISAVPGRLHQVFVNLITNACHAARKQGAAIEVGARYMGDGRICAWVRDNGQGIPSPQQNQIFEPFFSTKGEGQGTGLGLSIVRSIVEQHSGHIELHSEEGIGTSFTLTFPSIFS